MSMNKEFEGAFLYNIEFVPKGTNKTTWLSVWAKNELDASNYLILHNIWGKQVSIQPSTVNFLEAKERWHKERLSQRPFAEDRR